MKELLKPLFLLAIFAALMISVAYGQSPNELTPAAVEKATIPQRNLEVVKVLAVHDGDSYNVQRKSGNQWIRLYGVDAPELRSNFITKSQPFGKQAGDLVRGMIKGLNIVIDSTDTDQYGRMVCKVYLSIDSLNYLDYSAFLVESGLAWCVKAWMTPDEYKVLHEAQNNAKSSKLGLWALPGRKLLPSTWRKRYLFRK